MASRTSHIGRCLPSPVASAFASEHGITNKSSRPLSIFIGSNSLFARVRHYGSAILSLTSHSSCCLSSSIATAFMLECATMPGHMPSVLSSIFTFRISLQMSVCLMDSKASASNSSYILDAANIILLSSLVRDTLLQCQERSQVGNSNILLGI